jgi:hypothetical protein
METMQIDKFLNPENRGSDKRTYIGVYKIVGYKIVEPKIGASL